MAPPAMPMIMIAAPVVPTMIAAIMTAPIAAMTTANCCQFGVVQFQYIAALQIACDIKFHIPVSFLFSKRPTIIVFSTMA